MSTSAVQRLREGRDMNGGTLRVLALTAAMSASAGAMAETTTPPATLQTQTSGPARIETGSIGHRDVAIGAAARNLILPGASLAGTHPIPGLTAAHAAVGRETTAPTQPVAKPSPEEQDRSVLAMFYHARGDQPLWVDANGYTPKAREVIAVLKRAHEFGLDPKDYVVIDLPPASSTPTPEQLAQAESALSLAVLAYARHARGGLIPEPSTQLSSYLDRRPQWKRRDELLDELTYASDMARVLEGLHPQHAQFDLLRQAWLETKRASFARAARIPKGEDLKPGDRHADIAILRKRMGLPAEGANDPRVYDDRLAAAVAGVQRLKGLAITDGTLNGETRNKLNETIPGKTDQLAANMQMWRYMPADLGAFHVAVNVPEFLIRIVKNDETIFEERITAGLVSKQTPIFSARMTLVTFKSRWRVPDSIKVHEVWPSLLKGGGLMRQHKLEMRRIDSNELVSWQAIDWSKADMSNYYLTQPPGPWNQLGLVKFSFPNKHYVFMHDTPDKHMFAWTRRANSHGCMRIRNPLRMAEIILSEDQGWDRARIDDAVQNGPDHNVIELKNRVPTHITYFTARIGEGGQIETFPDIYGHERRFTQALAGQWDRIAKGRDHLAPVDETTPPRIVARKAPKADGEDGSVQSIISSALGGGF